MWEQSIGTFAVVFEDQGDEFVFHIEKTLAGGMSQTGTDGSSPVELRLSQHTEIHSRLRIQRHPEGLVCTVVGDTGDPRTDQVEPWATAATTAAAAVGRGHREFVWEAIIGTDPQVQGLDRLGALAGPVQAGPDIALTPGGVCMREFWQDRGRVDHDSWIHGRHSYPVVVSGRVVAYDWERVPAAAMRILRRVCAVMSLSTGQLWIPRSHPHQRCDGEPGLTIPIVAGATARPFPDIDGGAVWTGQLPPTTTFTVADWAAFAVEHLREDEGLETAVNAHYEAMRLESNGFSSLAHLTFVAAIEGYGMRLVPDETCQCDAHGPHPKGAAEKRFRKALKTVLSHRQIKELADGLAYERRSLTGHRGTLLGEEPTLGYLDFTLFDYPKESAFRASALGELKEASRVVLAEALKTAASQAAGDLQAGPPAP